jgi:hypothetical protein
MPRERGRRTALVMAPVKLNVQISTASFVCVPSLLVTLAPFKNYVQEHKSRLGAASWVASTLCWGAPCSSLKMSR